MVHFDQPNLRGQVLGGKYLVGEVIGAGGMGVVYEATHVELKAPCALKVVAAGRDDDVHGRRLLREARVLASLAGPHAVRVLDVGRLPDASPYIVMERLVGEPLSATLQRGPLAPERALSFVWQICEAVGEAHAHGIIHRDIKPSNVFVVNETTVKVLDFGLAMRLDRASHESTVTASEFAGSPAYMSPEQIRGRSELTERSDIWSMGVVLFEMLSGRLPFDGPNRAALLAAIVADPAARLRQLVPECPPELDRLIADCLEKNPADRPCNVPELQARLETVLASGAAPGSPALRSRAESRPDGATSTLTVVSPTVPSGPSGRTLRLAALASIGLALLVFLAFRAARDAGEREQAVQKREWGLAERLPEPTIPLDTVSADRPAHSESSDVVAPAVAESLAVDRPSLAAPAYDRRQQQGNGEKARASSPTPTPLPAPSAVREAIRTRH